MSNTPTPTPPPLDDKAAVETLRGMSERLRAELHNIIVGQDRVIDELLIALFARGHVLLIGVPGLAKTLMIRTLADALDLEFNRIQFTPDLMPSDITGTEVIQEDRSTGEREFRFLRGPIFANVILADEINRTPPKTQAALLEAMQEYQVTAGGTKHTLREPFFVMATQNPIEQEGTYPLPEAQMDRFMFNVLIDYPDEAEELEIMRRTTSTSVARVSKLLGADDIIALQETVRRVPVSEHVIGYAMRLARATRITTDEALVELKPLVAWGAGPRATQYLILGAKARAALSGRFHASTEDVAAVARPVLRHRVITNFTAEAQGMTSDDVVSILLDKIRPHDTGSLQDERLPKVVK